MIVQAQPATASTRDNSPVRVVPSLVAIAKLTRCLLTLKLADVGLFNGQDELLLSLEVGVPMSVSDVAEALDVRPSTVSKMVDRLSERGLVERSKGADQRRVLVSVTAAGIELTARILAIHAVIETEIARFLPEKTSEDLPAALADTEAALRRIIARLR
jgi:DNA-binding MarR family transcriptional regulator